MKKLILISLIIFALLSIKIFAIDVTNCTVLDTANGVYDLTTSFTNNEIGIYCMNITANNVTLDCHGYTMTGLGAISNQEGVFSSSINNITVKNCVMTGWFRGIDILYGGYNIILNNTIYQIYGACLRVTSANSTVTNNSVSNCTITGLQIQTGGNNIVSNNNITNTTTSIQLWYPATNDSFSNNMISNSITRDYHMNSGPDASNTFFETTFGIPRKILFDVASSYFNYSNDSNIWLATNGIVGHTLTRNIINWNTTNITWNETDSATDTANYTISGLLTNINYFVYNFSVLAYTINSGSSGSINFTIDLNTTSRIIEVNASLNKPPSWSSNTTSYPSSYSNQYSTFNATWSDDNDANGYNFSWFESNFSGSPTNYTTARIGNQSTYQEILPAGSFYFKFYANDTNNDWNSTPMWNFTINKAGTLTTAFLNSSASSRNYYKWQIANLSASLNVSGKTIYLDMNATGYGNNFASGTSSVQNLTNTSVLNLGVYNITAHFDGDQNYTSSSSTLYLTLLDGNANNFLNLEFNATRNQNKTIGYNSVPINITGFSNLTDNQDLTFNLYNSTTLLKSGSTATNITTLIPGEYKYVFNTSGGQNYTSGSITYYASVWNSTESITQNTTLSDVMANSQYNVTWTTAINLTNLAGFSGNISYNYSIPSDFTPYSISVRNSTNGSITSTVSGNNINFTTENVAGSTSKIENIYWTCMNCLNDSETLITYGSSFYDKNVSLITSLTNYNVSIQKLIISVPDQYSTSLYDMNLYRDSVLYTTGVSKISTDSAWNRVEITNFNFTSSTTFEVQVIQKTASVGSSAPSAPSGPSGGGGGGGGGEILSANFSFAVYPLLLQPDPYVTAVVPGSLVSWDINIYNYEVDIRKILDPEWEFSCSYGTENYSSYCLADWCTFKPKEEGITKAPASDLVIYTLNCTVPQYATINNEYRGTLLIWPKYYNKNISKPVRLSITPSNELPIYNQVAQTVGDVSISGMMIAKEAFLFNLICLTPECKNKSWLYVEVMKKPLLNYIGGLQTWMLFLIFAVAIYLLFR